MTKHSPGPWHPHVNAADDLEINTPDGQTVVKWYQSQECLSPGDPALIAAAPEMLELLRYLISDNGPNCDWTGFSEACELVKRIDGET